MDRLSGKVIIVTGGPSGIGRAYVEALSVEWTRVIIADVDGSAGQELEASQATAGNVVVSLSVDVADMGQVDRLARATVERFGRIDGLVNNAAFYQRPGPMARIPFEQISLDEWDLMMSVNLRGPSAAAVRWCLS